jgi:hypothetical protein
MYSSVEKGRGRGCTSCTLPFEPEGGWQFATTLGLNPKGGWEILPLPSANTRPDLNHHSVLCNVRRTSRRSAGKLWRWKMAIRESDDVDLGIGFRRTAD